MSSLPSFPAPRALRGPFSLEERCVVISLFDFTGQAVLPWAEAGYECHIYDLQHPGEDVERFPSGGSITKHRWDAEAGVESIAEDFWRREVRLVLSFPPCTDLAVSGARHFAAKLAKDPDIQNRAVRWARLAEALADHLGCPYAVENPVSVLSTLWRRPNYWFNPCDYGGYLSPEEPHPLWPDIIPLQDAYTKHTCLWTSADFIMPPARRVEPIMVSVVRADGTVTKSSPMWAKLGGKSLKTKNIRSATPRGFSRALFQTMGAQNG